MKKAPSSSRSISASEDGTSNRRSIALLISAVLFGVCLIGYRSYSYMNDTERIQLQQEDAREKEIDRSRREMMRARWKKAEVAQKAQDPAAREK
jgi:hypothetical protein